jgi:hypothetical protein
MDDFVALHQAVHGYKDGHQLLSSSLDLTREQQWQLLMMSDLSGPSFRRGFDNYLTGYPLEAGGIYCLAKTWFAPELPRPGCVWTHTLLITDTELARIRDFRSVVSCFKRPESYEDAARYTDAINLPSVTQLPFSIDSDVSKGVLSLLYGSPEKMVILASETSALQEALAIAIFSQQWPRLRRSFRFCTGALSLRDFPFDLVVAPPTIAQNHQVKRGVVYAGPNRNSIDEEPWVLASVEDLLSADSNSPLRRFLWTFGPDHSDGRRVFQALCAIYLAMKPDTESVEQVLSSVAHFFPESDSGKRLKRGLFGEGGYLGYQRKLEPEVLDAFVKNSASLTIPADIANVSQRAHLLTIKERITAEQIAHRALGLGGERAALFLDGFASAMSSTPESMYALPLALSVDVLARNASPLSNPRFWSNCSQERQLALIQYLPFLLHQVYEKSVLRAVLEAHAWTVVPALISLGGCEAVVTLLRWLDEIADQPEPDVERIERILSEHRTLVAQAIGREAFGPCALAMTTSVLDPHTEAVRSLGVNVWLVVVAAPIRLSTEANIRSKAFLLSLGLSIKPHGAVGLVRDGFSVVYNAAASHMISDESWNYVEQSLPWVWNTWDRCEWMVKGTVRDFVARQWSPQEFVNTFITEEQLHRALGQAQASRKGRRYLKSLCIRYREEAVKIDQLRALILSRFCR